MLARRAHENPRRSERPDRAHPQTAEKRRRSLRSRRKICCRRPQKQGLDAAAAAKGVPVTTLIFFSRKDMVPGLGPAPQFMDAVFHSGGEIAAADGGNIARLRCLRFAGGETAIDANLLTRSALGWKKNSRTSARTYCCHRRRQNSPNRAKADHDLKKAGQRVGRYGEDERVRFTRWNRFPISDR